MVQEKWTSRELERRYNLGTFERAVLRPPKASAVLTQMHGADAGSVLYGPAPAAGMSIFLGAFVAR